MKSILTLILTLLAFNFIFSQRQYYNWRDDRILNTFNYKGKSEITTDPNGNIYYLATTNRIRYYAFNGSNWYSNNLDFGTINSTKIPHENTGMEYYNNGVYFINEDQRVCRYQYNNNVWTHQILNASAPKARVDSKISISPSGKIYYVSENDAITVLYFMNWPPLFYGYLYNEFQHNDYWEIPQDMTDMECVQEELFFVNSYNNFSKVNFNGNFNELIGNQYGVKSGSKITTNNATNIFFVGNDNRVYLNWFDGGMWHVDWVSEHAPKAKSNTGIDYKDGKVFYFGEDGKPVVLIYNECKWDYHTLNQSANPMNNSDLLVGIHGKLYYPNNSDQVLHFVYPTMDNNNPYVHLRGKEFYEGSTKMDLKIMNYIADIYSYHPDLSYIVTARSTNYNLNESCLSCANPFSCGIQMKSDFDDIKSLGFNALRIIIGGVCPADENSNPGEIALKYLLKNYQDGGYQCFSNPHEIIPINQQLENIYFESIQTILDKAEEAGLKVILTPGGGFGKQNGLHAHTAYEDFLGRLADHFKNNTTLIGYDLHNEPSNGVLLDLDGDDVKEYNVPSLTKEQICSSGNKWVNEIRQKAPNHLITIGNTTPHFFVYEWDPTLFDLDFYSFHFYSDPHSTDLDQKYDHRERINADIKWVQRHIGSSVKPWVVGETGYSAPDDNDNEVVVSSTGESYPYGNEQDQLDYAEYIIDKVSACGGSGMSWWQYHDVRWNFDDDAKQNYWGFISSGQFTQQPSINGHKKLIYDNSPFVNPPPSSCDCTEPNVYYNYFPNRFNQNSISGTITNLQNEPIHGAVVSAHSVSGEVVYTFTKSDGTYDLFLDANEIYDLLVSHIGYEHKTILPWMSDQIWPLNLPGLNSNASLRKIIDCQKETIIKFGKKSAQTFEESELNLNIYPNPSEGLFNISSNLPVLSYVIYDSRGVVVKNEKTSSTRFSIDCSGFTPGVYIVELSTESGKENRKIIIK